MFMTFWKSRSGNFSMLFALVLPVLLGAVAVSVDFAKLTTAHSKVQNAVDAAVLAASRINDKALSREQVFQDYLLANLETESQLFNIKGEIEIDTGLNYISTKGTAPQ